MFGIGPGELVVILIVALVVLGPEKLPAVARTLGRLTGELRRMSTEFQRTMNMEIEPDIRPEAAQATPPATADKTADGPPDEKPCQANAAELARARAYIDESSAIVPEAAGNAAAETSTAAAPAKERDPA